MVKRSENMMSTWRVQFDGCSTLVPGCGFVADKSPKGGGSRGPADAAGVLAALVNHDLEDADQRALFGAAIGRDGFELPGQQDLISAQQIVAFVADTVKKGSTDHWIRLRSAMRAIENPRLGTMERRAHVLEEISRTAEAFSPEDDPFAMVSFWLCTKCGVKIESCLSFDTCPNLMPDDTICDGKGSLGYEEADGISSERQALVSELVLSLGGIEESFRRLDHRVVHSALMRRRAVTRIAAELCISVNAFNDAKTDVRKLAKNFDQVSRAIKGRLDAKKGRDESDDA